MRFKRARRGLDENKSFQRLIIGSKHHKATPEFHALMIVIKGNIFAIDFSFSVSKTTLQLQMTVHLSVRLQNPSTA